MKNAMREKNAIESRAEFHGKLIIIEIRAV